MDLRRNVKNRFSNIISFATSANDITVILSRVDGNIFAGSGNTRVAQQEI